MEQNHDTNNEKAVASCHHPTADGQLSSVRRECRIHHCCVVRAGDQYTSKRSSDGNIRLDGTTNHGSNVLQH
jgi:hypothetical protein